jgi:regulator of protease activity HflC (stomatin/prohibitin superfamily)
MAEQKKPPGEDPLKRLLLEAGAEMDARLRDWIAKSSGKPGITRTRASTGQPSGFPAPSGQRDPGNAESDSSAQRKAFEAKLRKWILWGVFGFLPAYSVGKYFFNQFIVGVKWKPRTDFQEFGGINGQDFSDVITSVISGFFGEITMSGFMSSIVPLAIFIVGIIFVIKAIRVVPQQRALVVERLGRFDRVLEPGLRFTIPFIDRVSSRHDLREVPLDVPSQVCITKDNTQLQVDGILYFQVTDPKLATYGSSNYIVAITQLAQTTLRSVVGKLELDKTFEERDMINHAVVSALDQAAMNWGVKVLRYEIKDLTPPKEILHAMQAQITAEREKRALIAASEGRKQEQINIAMGQKEAAIAKSEGDKISDINQAQGEAAAILAKAEANAEAIRKIAMAIGSEGGLQAVNLKVAEQYVAALSNIARTGNTIVVPQNLTDIAGLVTTATSVLKAQPK